MGPLESAGARLPLSAASARRAGLGPLRHVRSTGSTNDDLAGEARRGHTGSAVLVADHQTAGRGRLGRRWSDAGHPRGGGETSLLVSFRLPAAVGEASDRVAAVSAAARAAAARAVSATGAAVRAKWPNDLLIEMPSAEPAEPSESPASETGGASVGGWAATWASTAPASETRGASGKLAGVLSEIVDGDRPLVVVGLGLNVAPVPGEPGAASLAEAGATVTRDELLAALLDVLPAYLADPARARAELRSASATIGRQVRVERADGTSVTGTARDIDDWGRLVVVAAGGEQRIDAGDVIHLRPS